MLAAALLAVLWARPARAQADDGEKRRQAGEHVVQGDQYKEKGQYEKAAREYRKAYDLVPHPLLIFNLAQVYRLGGDTEKALEHYQKYLDEDPQGPAAEQARELADALRAELAARPPPPKKRAVSPRGKWLRIGGMATAGLGVVFLGVGVKYGLDAKNASNDISGHDGAWDKDTLSLEKSGPRAERRMLVFTALGAAALAGGGVLYWMGMRTTEEGPTVTPTGSADEVGLAVVGSF